MIFRAIALSMALLIGIGTIVPLATEYAEAGPRKTRKYKKKQKKYKKYSKAWWRERRKRIRRRNSLRHANAYCVCVKFGWQKREKPPETHR
jgi:hypothetical protein